MVAALVVRQELAEHSVLALFVVGASAEYQMSVECPVLPIVGMGAVPASVFRGFRQLLFG